MTLLWMLVLAAAAMAVVSGRSADKPHAHQGILKPFDGRPLRMDLSAAQLSQLSNGDAVIHKERDGTSGRGVVVQDIHAPASTCMSKIRDLPNYPRMVPHVKKVQIYDEETFSNGTTQIGAAFNVGMMGFGMGYFLKLTHEPKFNTLTWTLDYKRNSDLDDSVGHWEVADHPSKSGWTRLLYSTKIKLFPWVPEFVVGFLTNKALTESTSWVKKESETEAKKKEQNSNTGDIRDASDPPQRGLRKWLNIKGGFRGALRMSRVVPIARNR